MTGATKRYNSRQPARQQCTYGLWNARMQFTNLIHSWSLSFVLWINDMIGTFNRELNCLGFFQSLQELQPSSIQPIRVFTLAPGFYFILWAKIPLRRLKCCGRSNVPGFTPIPPQWVLDLSCVLCCSLHTVQGHWATEIELPVKAELESDHESKCFFFIGLGYACIAPPVFCFVACLIILKRPFDCSNCFFRASTITSSLRPQTGRGDLGKSSPDNRRHGRTPATFTLSSCALSTLSNSYLVH